MCVCFQWHFYTICILFYTLDCRQNDVCNVHIYYQTNTLYLWLLLCVVDNFGNAIWFNTLFFVGRLGTRLQCWNNIMNKMCFRQFNEYENMLEPYFDPINLIKTLMSNIIFQMSPNRKTFAWLNRLRFQLLSKVLQKPYYLLMSAIKINKFGKVDS